MMRKGRRWLLSLLLAALLAGVLTTAFAAETTAGEFVLVAEAGGELVIAPEYVEYTEGQSILAALASSGHEFTGLDNGVVTAIDDVTGNFTRSDQTGSYDLSIPASGVTHYRFSENVETSQPSEGLQLLMTAMADYQKEDADVQAAAAAEYETACTQFVGIGTSSAETLAKKLSDAMTAYKDSLSGTT